MAPPIRFGQGPFNSGDQGRLWSEPAYESQLPLRSLLDAGARTRTLAVRISEAPLVRGAIGVRVLRVYCEGRGRGRRPASSGACAQDVWDSAAGGGNSGERGEEWSGMRGGDGGWASCHARSPAGSLALSRSSSVSRRALVLITGDDGIEADADHNKCIVFLTDTQCSLWCGCGNAPKRASCAGEDLYCVCHKRQPRQQFENAAQHHARFPTSGPEDHLRGPQPALRHNHDEGRVDWEEKK